MQKPNKMTAKATLLEKKTSSSVAGAGNVAGTGSVFMSRTMSVACIVSITIILSLYYMAAEDTHPYMTLSVSASSRYSSSNVIVSVMRSAVGARGFLVDGPKCRIPDVDPYDKDIRKFVHTMPHISCSKQPPLTYMEKGDGYATLIIDRHVIKTYSKQGVQCCYSNITRGHSEKKPDDTYDISTCRDFKDAVNITEGFILVKCVTQKRKKEVYKNTHAVVNVTPEIKRRLKTNTTNDTRPLSVLLIGIDSISRLNSLRTMPRTLEYLNENGWLELKGYNKIADNTFPNLMAILTGIEGDAAYNVCLPTVLYRLDNCSFIWSTFEENGYTTAYAEDAAPISTFNFHKIGFVNPPTDYYFRPFIQASEKQLKGINKYSMRYCVGPVSAGERILDYAREFSTTFSKDPNFGLFWMNTFSHNDLNMPSGMDNQMLHFFQGLADRGVNDNSMIVFFSDHGLRFGNIRQTKIGWLEERLPFIYIYVPEWFREKYPLEFRNLQVNMNRLTTPYDLHMTLQDVLVLSGRTDSIISSSGCPKCHSLFREVSINRSCEDAAISAHWCMCTAFTEISTKNTVVQHAADFIVSRIQKNVNNAGANISKKCAKLKLNRIMISQVGESPLKNETYYLIFIETMPGRGKFEATVSVNNTDTKLQNSANLKFHLVSSISRLDTYAGQSNCVNDANLKKYCYCR